MKSILTSILVVLVLSFVMVFSSSSIVIDDLKNRYIYADAVTLCSGEIEMESVSPLNGFKVVSDVNASNGRAVEASGPKSIENPTMYTEVCLYSSGNAKIQILAKADSSSTDSFWIRKDTTNINLDIDEGKGYVWKTVDALSLSAGNNIIKLATREPGVKIDRIKVIGSSAPTTTPIPTPVLTSTPIPTITLIPTPIPTVTPPTSVLYPADILKNKYGWKIVLPTGEEIKTTDNPGFLTLTNEYFRLNSNKNAIVFKAPIRADNGSTSNSSYIRSELRERTADGKANMYWTTAGKHIMYVKQAITHLPNKEKIMIASQVHGNKSAGIDDAMVLRLEGDNLFLKFNGGRLRPNLIVKTDAGFNGKYTLGRMHEVIFEVVDGKHMAYYSEDGNLYNAYMSGNADKYAVKDNGNKVLMTLNYNEAYFKAGNYTQSNKNIEGCSLSTMQNCDSSSNPNYGEVVIYDLWVSHK